MNRGIRRCFSPFRCAWILAVVAVLGACAHPIAITPLDEAARSVAPASSKKVAYVMTDADRGKLVTTAGGGGDTVSYYPYRDLEKAIRDALRAVYSDVVVIRSPNDSAAIQANGVSFIFAPEISTSSSSSSMLAWPPTAFTIELACTVTDPVGSVVARIRVVGTGSAEFSEFKTDFGLAGRRAASDLSKKLQDELNASSRLR